MTKIAGAQNKIAMNLDAILTLAQNIFTTVSMLM